MIEITRLTKRFGAKTVLDDVSLLVEPGSVYGLIGRNGAGKSTLLHCLMNICRPTSGRVRVDGIIDSVDIRRRVAWVGRSGEQDRRLGAGHDLQLGRAPSRVGEHRGRPPPHEFVGDLSRPHRRRGSGMRNAIRKIWREQRVRRAVCLTITVVYSLSLIVLFNARVEIQEGMVLTPEDEAELAAQFAGFDVFIAERWAETMLFAILAVFFAVGGILDERKTDSLHFTLGLPVARSAWLRAQAVVGGLSLLVLIISSILIIWALGDASLGRMAMAGLVQCLTGLCILCAVFVSGALTRSGIIQFLVGMAVIVFLGVVRHPWNLFESPSTIILTGAFPTGLVVTALLFILGTYALAERRLRTLDF